MRRARTARAPAAPVNQNFPRRAVACAGSSRLDWHAAENRGEGRRRARTRDGGPAAPPGLALRVGQSACSAGPGGGPPVDGPLRRDHHEPHHRAARGHGPGAGHETKPRILPERVARRARRRKRSVPGMNSTWGRG